MTNEPALAASLGGSPVGSPEGLTGGLPGSAPGGLTGGLPGDQVAEVIEATADSIGEPVLTYSLGGSPLGSPGGSPVGTPGGLTGDLSGDSPGGLTGDSSGGLTGDVSGGLFGNSFGAETTTEIIDPKVILHPLSTTESVAISEVQVETTQLRINSFLTMPKLTQRSQLTLTALMNIFLYHIFKGTFMFILNFACYRLKGVSQQECICM